MRLLVGILLAILSLSQTLWAGDPATLRTLLTGDDNRGWEAVGRLDIGGQSFCTGALIAPDLVLTAAHCMFNPDTGQAYDVETIQFLAGHRNGRANAKARVALAISHPDFDFSDVNGFGRATNDLALLRLESPIRKSLIIPYETAPRPRKSAAVGVVSYARGREESPSLQEQCQVLARRSGTLILSCEVDFGSSGAPVFVVGDDGAARIVSVISAKGEINGQAVSLGTGLEKPLGDLMAILAHKESEAPQTPGTVRILRLGDQNSADGARFVRP